MMPVETKYARSSGVHIAYQVVGDSPLDLVFVPGWISHVEQNWDHPLYARFLHRLASFSRLIVFDKRGTGLSDPVAELPTLEQRMDDVRAVMEAVGSTQAVIMGASEGGIMSALFAATYPQRTKALIICGSFARRLWAADYPWAPTPEMRQRFFDLIVDDWGNVVDLAVLSPSMARDETFCRWWATYLRHSASPGMALALAQMNTQIDVRHVLPTIHVPTLVLHRTGDLDVNVEEGRYIAEHIPGAQFVELPGDDHLVFTGDADGLFDRIEAFLITLRQVPEPTRALVTVLAVKTSEVSPFIDADLRLVRQELTAFRGTEVTADRQQIMVTFDGPSRAIRCAIAIRERLRDGQHRIQAGLHTGEFEVRVNAFSGTALLIASQMSAQAAEGQILVSSTVKDLVAGSNLSFRDRGHQALVKGSGTWHLFELATEDQIQLTPRELDVMRLVAQGLTNPDIARHLSLSEHTVHRHIANVYNRLSVSTRAAAVAYCLQHKLL